MSLMKKLSNNKNTISLSINDKVIHYLQNSTHCSTNKSLTMFEKSSSSTTTTTTSNFFSIQHRLRSCSENDSISSSSSSVNDSLSRSDTSNESSLSDPIAQSSLTSSNLLSEEDIDFNIGFDQISDNNDFDEEDDSEYISNKNNNDAVTLLGEPILDGRINGQEESPHQSSNSTSYSDEYEPNNDDSTIKRQYTNFLNDSTHTLCSPDRFSAYTEDDEPEDEKLNGFGIRSNSLSFVKLNDASNFVEKPPKKVVRFADVMGLDLESIRYMTPPDQTTASLLQECVRLQLGQLRFSKNQLDLLDISPTRSRSSSSVSLSSPTKTYNLISKNFSSPTNIVPLIYNQQVMLECLYTKNSTACGTIRVHNCSYDKQVFIRITYDDWITYDDIEARHSMNYAHDNTDTFSFEIILPKSYDDIGKSKRILFAVCLQAMGQEFWDNNQGWNYVLDVFEKR